MAETRSTIPRRSAWHFPRSTSSTGRRSRTDRSMPGSRSSTTSKDKKSADPSETETRELTLEDAIAIAILLQKNEQFAEAGEVYRRVLEAAPDHPRALHYAGVLAHQQGRRDDAIEFIGRSLVHAPDEADWHSNFGIVLQSD